MNIKKGDIILVHSRNFISRIIQFGMNVERWRWLSFKPFWKHVCNHAAICIDTGIIAEALSSGVTIHSFDRAYRNITNADITVYRPPLSESQLNFIYQKAVKYRGVRYQFENFIQYIPKILLGIWLGRTYINAEDKLYCTEYVALVLNRITFGELFPKYWRTSPSGVQSWCEKVCAKIAEIIIDKDGNWKYNFYE